MSAPRLLLLVALLLLAGLSPAWLLAKQRTDEVQVGGAATGLAAMRAALPEPIERLSMATESGDWGASWPAADWR